MSNQLIEIPSQDGLSWLPPAIRSICVRMLKKFLKKLNAKSLILTFHEDVKEEDEEKEVTAAFSSRLFPLNVSEHLDMLVEENIKMQAELTHLKKRSNFLEDFRNKQLGLPTRHQEHVFNEWLAADTKHLQAFNQFRIAAENAKK